jgi:hypothetical protein
MRAFAGSLSDNRLACHKHSVPLRLIHIVKDGIFICSTNSSSRIASC